MQRRPLLLTLSPFFLFLSLFFALSVSLCLSPLSSGSFFFPYSLRYRTQGVGVLRSCLPAFLSEHLSMDYFLNPLKKKTTLCVQSVL